MNKMTSSLMMVFDGSVVDRTEFFAHIRNAVMEFTGECMSLDALVCEIAKNIFDHAHGLGSLAIEFRNDSFEFKISDNGKTSYDFDTCSIQSRLVGTGVNFGAGLRTICDLANDLDIELHIDTSKGFSYSGIYIPSRHVD